MPVGILALQGDFEAHARALERVGLAPVPVRTAAELEDASGLVLPGGESTAMLRQAVDEGLFEPLRRRIASGVPVLATCAGIVLLAREVTPGQPSLGVLDVAVLRNAYGRQLASAVVALRIAASLGGPPEMEGVFIRAPRITATGPGVEILAWRDDDPVLVQQGTILAATFHPELTGDLRVHRRFAGFLQNPPAAVSPRT